MKEFINIIANYESSVYFSISFVALIFFDITWIVLVGTMAVLKTDSGANTLNTLIKLQVL